jgi:hypothetical protein
MQPKRYTFYKSVRRNEENFGEGVYLGRVGRNIENKERILVRKPGLNLKTYIITAKSVKEDSKKEELIIYYDFRNHLKPNKYEREFINSLEKRFWKI